MSQVTKKEEINLLDFTPEVLKIIFNNIKEFKDLTNIQQSHPYLYNVISEHTEEISSSHPKIITLDELRTFPNLHKINELLYIVINSINEVSVLTTYVKHLHKANFVIIADNIDIFNKIVKSILTSYYNFEYFGFIFRLNDTPIILIFETLDKSCTFNTGDTLLYLLKNVPKYSSLWKIQTFYSLYDVKILNIGLYDILSRLQFIHVGNEIETEPVLLDDLMFNFLRGLNLMNILGTTLNMTNTRITSKRILFKILKLYVEQNQYITIDYTTNFNLPLNMFNSLHIEHKLYQPINSTFNLNSLETISSLYTHNVNDVLLGSLINFNTHTYTETHTYNDIFYIFNPINIGKFVEDNKVMGYM